MSASASNSAPIDIAVAGLGIVSAAGRGVAENLASLRANRDGLGPLTRFQSPRCGQLPVAQVEGVDEAPRALALARIALKEALDGAGVVPRTGLALGMTVGGMPESEEQVARLMKGEPADESVWERHECGYVAATLAREFGLDGPCLTISNACASGAEAIACGAELLLSGEADRMVAGGVDALCRLTLNGFASLLVVDPEGCRPFDRAREGMSLGEGAAFLVLKRGANSGEVVLAGWGNSCDAYHPTAPDPDGRGAEAAMRAALADTTPRDTIDYINAHGTATPDNDRAEGRAIRRLFGAQPPPVSSTKRLFGHTLGAAGAIEAVVCSLALTEGLLPGTPGLQDPDPECGIVPLKTPVEAQPRAVLSNSFGFGGNNSVLCFRLSS